MSKKVLIIDGNLFARKMFYKFRHLSTKIRMKDLDIISPKYQNRTIEFERPREDSEKMFDRKTGKSSTIITSGKIEKKLEEMKLQESVISIKTGVAYGILRSLIAIHKNHDISRTVFCYDPLVRDRTVHLRTEIFPDYKISREEKSRRNPEETEEFYNQLNLAHYIIYYLGIKQAWTTNFEADDLLKYYSHKVYKKRECFLLTSDHDLFQLLSNRVSILKIGKNEQIYTDSDFVREYGIHPSKYLDVMNLCGCSSDDVPGIEGIGEKTAIDIIKRFRNLKRLIREYRKRKEDISPKVYKLLEKDRKKKFSTIKKTRKLVKLYGLSDELKDNLTKKKGKGDINRLIAILKILKFKSLYSKSELAVIKKIVSNNSKK